jgi:hypothetical protein
MLLLVRKQNINASWTSWRASLEEKGRGGREEIDNETPRVGVPVVL